MSGQAAFAERPSGILVPSTMEKHQYTLPEADFVKLRRLMKFAREFGFIAMYHCADCKEPVQLKQRDRLVTVDASGGRLSLSCGCSTWTVKALQGPSGVKR